MINKSNEKVPMPEQEPEIRNNNFEEVATGYEDNMAVDEANRCLQCKHAPCMKGCPVNVQIPEFIKQIQEGDFEAGYRTIAETNLLPAICGRVCPQEKQCEKYCVRGIKGEPVGIGYLERFAADKHIAVKKKNKDKEKALTPDYKKDKKVAVIGSGPAGLTCAADLAKKGYKVTIFEAFHTPGGVLVYGIPEFRLPKALVKEEINTLTDLGVEIEMNCVVGKTITIDELKEKGYEAFFIGVGAGLPNFMKIPGENLNGVYTSNEYLTRINLMKAYQFPDYDTPVNVGNRVAVIGGGNVAMDSARCAKRLGAKEVYIIYRRGIEEMPARVEEVHHAKEEGIIFETLTNPVKITGDDKGTVKALECVRMELGEPDESGRRSPKEIPGSNFVFDVDNVIIAIGQTPNPLIAKTTEGLNINKKGCIVIEEETGKTSLEGVYAGGDIVTGAATVILAMGAGKKAAEAIDNYFSDDSHNDK